MADSPVCQINLTLCFPKLPFFGPAAPQSENGVSLEDDFDVTNA
jgi:hypothetical protein